MRVDNCCAVGDVIMAGPHGREQLGYLKHHEDALYYGLHSPRTAACAQVLFAGPLGLERSHSYLTQIRWARFLAKLGFEVLRFDYRGHGESTGQFHSFHFGHWRNDLIRAAEFLTQRGKKIPLYLHGLRLGALLSAALFADHTFHCDGLLLWDAPASGGALLTQVLRRRLLNDLAEQPTHGRPTAAHLMSALERGESVEIDGYPWTKELWKSAQHMPLHLPAEQETRPWLVVQFDQSGSRSTPDGSHYHAVTITRPPFWADDPWLQPDLCDLFTFSSQKFQEWTSAPARQK